MTEGAFGPGIVISHLLVTGTGRAINTDANYEFPQEVPFGEEQTIQNVLNSNGDEDHYVHVQAKDGAGNVSEIKRSLPFRFDNMPPILNSIGAISSSSYNPVWAKANDNITLTLSFSEKVIISGAAPGLWINIGSGPGTGNSVTASFAGDLSSGVAALETQLYLRNH